MRGPLPTQRTNGECLAVSAGGSEGTFYFSGGIGPVISGWHAEPDEAPSSLSPYVGEYRGRDVFAVRARGADAERSLAHIYDASLDLFNRVGHRYRCIHMQMLATGRHRQTRRVRRRVESAHISRAFLVRPDGARRGPRGARRTHTPSAASRSTSSCDVIILDVASGRLDVLELLTSRDLRFFVEIIQDSGRLERRLFR